MPRKLFKQDYTVEEVLEAIDRAIDTLRSSTWVIEHYLAPAMYIRLLLSALEAVAERATNVSDPPTEDELTVILEELYDVYKEFEELKGDKYLYSVFAYDNPVTNILEWLENQFPPLEIVNRLPEYSEFEDWDVILDESVIVAWEAQSLVNDIAEELPQIIERLENLIESGTASREDIYEIAEQLKQLSSNIDWIEKVHDQTISRMQRVFIAFYEEAKEWIQRNGLPED